ncbi:MAG: Uma2 family endonuclease [Bacteroidia bacterium]|nr:Uma2 family endonuclease [Bacteroidia bacterium]
MSRIFVSGLLNEPGNSRISSRPFPPPDFIIEILSESTEDRDRGIKMIDYALRQVQEYWLIDPEAKALEQYFYRITPSG